MARVDFSVMTPTFQAEAFIEQCVRSCADQGVSLEHLVQDGASTDKTAARARDLGASVEVASDAGMYDALNRALARATGRYLTHLNADEQLLPGALQAARTVLDEADDHTVVSGDVVIVDASLEPIAYRTVTPQRRLHATYTPGATVLTAATFFPRALLDKGVLGYDASYRRLGDLDLFKRLTEHGVRWRTIDRPLAVFVDHGDNLALSPETSVEGRRFLGSSLRTRLLSPVGRLLYWCEKALAGGYRRRDVRLDLYRPGSERRSPIESRAVGWRWNPFEA